MLTATESDRVEAGAEEKDGQFSRASNTGTDLTARAPNGLFGARRGVLRDAHLQAEHAQGGCCRALAEGGDGRRKHTVLRFFRKLPSGGVGQLVRLLPVDEHQPATTAGENSSSIIEAVLVEVHEQLARTLHRDGTPARRDHRLDAVGVEPEQYGVLAAAAKAPCTLSLGVAFIFCR